MSSLRQIYLKFISLGFVLAVLLLFVNISLLCPPAKAVLRQHHEGAGVLRYHAQHSLQDQRDITWQVILFPEGKTDSQQHWYLRLVGFPGRAAFRHPGPLEVFTPDLKILLADDLFPESAPAPNVGQFDFTPILPQLSANGSLQLDLPLQGEENGLTLKIPGQVITEWKLLVDSDAPIRQ